MSNKPISAFIVTCDRPRILEACIHAVRWADEIIILDKGFGAPVHVDQSKYPNVRVHLTDWSPTVEGSRAEAVSKCTHEWIIALDDDEILSSRCEEIFRENVNSDSPIDVFQVPIKHYILGRHDQRAPYWPEWRNTLYRKGFVHYNSTVHAGVGLRSGSRVCQFHPTSQAWIDHLSHESVHVWIEKTNRYTSQKNRAGVQVPVDLAVFARLNLKHHLEQIAQWPDDYLQANAILHSLYEIIDGLKRWEQVSLPDGDAVFDAIVEGVLKRGSNDE